MHKQRCDLNSCRANVRVMYELCLLKKEQKEENEELFSICAWKSRKRAKKPKTPKRVLWKYTHKSFTPRPELLLHLLFLKDNINQDSKIMMMNIYLAAALALLPTLFSPSFLRIFNLPMAACIL
jgi:CRISPR/Cas system-associated endonuclease Cas3-HD